MKISVIVTTYNRPKLLKETLSSILNQTFKDFELIVVDNYSNYDFINLIKSLNDTRIKAYQNKNNGIIAVNRNYGIKKSKGKFIAFCDDDDIWIKTKLQIQYNQIKKNKSDIICSNISVFKNYTNNVLFKTNAKKPSSLYHLLWLNQVFTSTVLAKKSELLIFNEDPNLITVEDYELWIKLMIRGYKFDFVNKSLIFYRKAPDGAYTNNYDKRNIILIYLYRSIQKMKLNKLTYFYLQILIINQFIRFLYQKLKEIFK
tara:strand:+ start:63 stop:836 length:774 start_codon:yes stop_codon:yes gene_type:complete